MNVCTIIAKNYVAQARVLARSFAEHHPGSELSVLVIDDHEGYLDPEQEPFRLLTPSEIGCEEFEMMAVRYDIVELSTAVKPWLLRHLLQDGTPAITYLDPDIRVYGSLEALDGLAQEHGVVLTPHNTLPIPDDGERPTQIDILIAGVYNLGFVSLGAGAETERVLDWWSDRLLRDCRVDPVYGYFVDQRWFDLAPGFVSDYAIVRDPEFNIAYWNAHARQLQITGDGYAVDGRSLRFFHFSGFDPLQPHLLSRHQTRVRLSDQPALAQICREYADETMAEGYEEARQWPYTYGTLADGTHFSRPLRTLSTAGLESGSLTESPFTAAGFEALVDWLADTPDGAPDGVNRALAHIYESRDDVRRAFPDIDLHVAAFLDWARTSEDPILDLPARLKPGRTTAPVPPPPSAARMRARSSRPRRSSHCGA